MSFLKTVRYLRGGGGQPVPPPSGGPPPLEILDPPLTKDKKLTIYSVQPGEVPGELCLLPPAAGLPAVSGTGGQATHLQYKKN